MPESLSRLGELKLLLMHYESLKPAMNEKVAQNVPEAQPGSRSGRSPESCSKSESERLLDEACRLVQDHADRHHTGSHLSPQSAHDIRRGLVLLLSKYEIRARQ